ncbi:Transcription factor bHLH25 [Spatholobus suberectus]|nr:Transcription factor bHLH25 [Spatholobus suberectus]
MEDPTFLHQWHLSSIDEPNLLPIAAAFGETLQHHALTYPNFNPRTSMETALADIERPTKHHKNNINWNSNRSAQTSETQFVSFPNLFSLEDSDHVNPFGLMMAKDEMVCPVTNISRTPPDTISQGTLGNHNYVFKACQEAKKIGTRSKHSQPQDHIMAERKRREKLSQRFIALSALVPGLQKTDKASVLGDAIKYLKQLQEKVKALQEEQNMKKNVESVVVVKKSHLSSDVNNSSEYDDPFDEALPEIEVRFCERNVLVRVHCEKSKGVVEKTIQEIEKLHLKVTNSSAMTFGRCALDITIIAQMDIEFCMGVKDLVRNLRSAFTSFM